MKHCQQRALVKMEYFPSQEFDNDMQQHEDSMNDQNFPHHKGRSSKSVGKVKKSSRPIEFRDYPG
jgi:hypothetical protein